MPLLSTENEVRASLKLLQHQYDYNRWVFDRVRPFVHGRVCEVGCGIGNITQFLLNCENVVGIEPSANSYDEVRNRFRDHQNVRFVNCFLSDCPREHVRAESFDTVLCLNVLMEIADDIEAMRDMRKLVGPKGRIVVLVPAHMGLMGSLDRTYGFHRRYNRRSLAAVFQEAGVGPIASRYSNLLGFFGWWWHSRCLKRTRIDARAAGLFDKLVPFLDVFERVVHPPFGQSLIMAGTPMPLDPKAE